MLHKILHRIITVVIVLTMIVIEKWYILIVAMVVILNKMYINLFSSHILEKFGLFYFLCFLATSSSTLFILIFKGT